MGIAIFTPYFCTTLKRPTPPPLQKIVNLFLLKTDFTWDSPRNRLQLSIYTFCFFYYFKFFYPCDCYGRFYGVLDRSNRDVTVSGGTFEKF